MLTSADISRLQSAGLKTQFFKQYDKTETYYEKITTEIPSTGSDEDYGWLGESPDLREWKDERAPKSLLEHGFTLVNKDYEATIAVGRNAIADDKYGQVKIRAQKLGERAKKGYDKKIVEYIEDAHGELCYDGQNFFDTDHEEGASGTQSNYSSTGLALSVANAKTVITTMKGYKDDQGEKVGIKPTHIMVPEALEFTAEQIFNPQVLAGSTTEANRVLAGKLKIIVNPYLTSDTAWYVMDLSQAVKPFIFQNRQKLTWVALDKPDSYELFMRKTIYYGVDGRFRFGGGDWRLCYKAVA